MSANMFGDEPKKPKPKKVRAENADAVLEIEAAYVTKFEQRWGFTARRSFGRDRKHFSDLERTWGKDDVIRLLDTFFATTDQRVVRSDYSVAAFFGLAQHLKLLGQRRVVDERTAANVDAAARATGRKP